MNVEPCIMCAAALLKLQVATIYYGCANDKFGGEISFTSHYIVVAFNIIILPGCGSVVDMPSVQERVGPGSGYRVRLSGGHRAEEAVDMLKLFYDGQNPNAPNPKVKGVRVNRIVEDVSRDPASSSISGR